MRKGTHAAPVLCCLLLALLAGRLVSAAGEAEEQKAKPRYRAVVVCHNEPPNDGTVSCAHYRPNYMLEPAGAMECGLRGRTSKIEWELLAPRGELDVYRFTRRFPLAEAAEAKTVKEVEFKDTRIVIFQDEAQTIVIEPRGKVAADSKTGPPPMKVPVIEISGGDGSSRAKAIVLEAPSFQAALDAMYYLKEKRYPRPRWKMESTTEKTQPLWRERFDFTGPVKAKRTLHFAFPAGGYEESADDTDASTRDSLVEEMVADARVPTAQDVSGAWSSGPNLVGEDLQLWQEGERIVGRGYLWGCVGQDAFNIEGTIRAGVLRVQYTFSSIHQEQRAYRVVTKDGKVRLVDRSEGGWKFTPQPELAAEREKLSAEQK